MIDTYDFHLARDGEMFGATYRAEHEVAARSLALADLNDAWRAHYGDFDDLVADSDGFSLDRRAGADARRALSEGLAEMVEDGRLAPADHAWLIATLDNL